MSCPLNVLMDLPIEELGDGIDLIVVTGARELHEFKHKVVEPRGGGWQMDASGLECRGVLSGAGHFVDLRFDQSRVGTIRRSLLDEILAE